MSPHGEHLRLGVVVMGCPDCDRDWSGPGHRGGEGDDYRMVSMSKIVEVVARLLRDLDRAEQSNPGVWLNPWDECTEETRDRYRARARDLLIPVSDGWSGR